MEIQRILAYWRMVFAGVGITLMAGSFFAAGVLNVILASVVGGITLLAGFILAMYE